MKRGKITIHPSAGSRHRWYIETSDGGAFEGGPYADEDIARKSGEAYAKEKGIELVETRAGVDMELEQ